MDLQVFTFILSLTSILLSVFAIVVNSGRNKIQRNNFNVNRLTGEANKRLWIRLIIKFMKDNEEHLNLGKGIKFDDEKSIESIAKTKYHNLLILAVDTSLRNEGVVQCFEIVFENELKDSYFKNKKEAWNPKK